MKNVGFKWQWLTILPQKWITLLQANNHNSDCQEPFLLTWINFNPSMDK